MSRNRNENSILTTIERLTGKTPCPEYLRNSLNKYLYVENLFPGSVRKPGKKTKGKLEKPNTDSLVLNILALDEAFRGETELVSRIVMKDISSKELSEKIIATEEELKRRFDVYNYWIQRIQSLKLLLTDNSIDLKTMRLDEKLNNVPVIEFSSVPVSFALRAIHQLEQNEERGRLGRPTADEYTERADAYLALGDYPKADLNAIKALESDETHPKAWFIRARVALLLRNKALNSMRFQEMVASEFADPMSAQESSAREMASEEVDRAYSYTRTLEEILPKALLHWPKLSHGQYDHNELRTQLRDLFINHVFACVTTDSYRNLDSRRFYVANGLGEEWKLKYRNLFNQAYWDSKEETFQLEENEKFPLEENEKLALKLIFDERDKKGILFFDLFDKSKLAKDLKLLHMRWMFKLDGYEKHWQELSDYASNSLGGDVLERNILRDSNLSKFWQIHLSMNEGENAVLSSLISWQLQVMENSQCSQNIVILTQLALFFHRQYAQQKFSTCVDICNFALKYTVDNGNPRSYQDSINHPYDEMIQMPVRRTLYWQYLKALSTIKALEATQIPSDQYIELLMQAESLSKSFRDTTQCFWLESEEYEGGGGSDWEVEPYDVDLRDEQIWLNVIQTILPVVQCERSKIKLNALATRLASVE